MKESSCTQVLTAGELAAVFLPGQGMLGASLQLAGRELLGRVEDLASAAAKGGTAGIPLLYPWANRLSSTRFRTAGREVVLEPTSSMLHLDEHGLPIHGVPWSRLSWEVTEATATTLGARLEWNREELLAVFPFRHRVELAVVLDPDGLRVETTVHASGGDTVPVSFGFHPYFSLAGQPRGRWRLTLPGMRRLTLDGWGIPTGAEMPFAGFDAALGEQSFDDGFTVGRDTAALSLTGPNHRVTLELLSGYPCTQVFAPRDKDYVALEPMTAPTSALTQGRGLRLLQPGDQFQAVFRIHVARLR